ncbi:MAG: ABC transporter ATP-binding protein [Flavobacteriales bacterium]|nr:ABC transporter ATP-binding protein [Flavobacteriales bacterium]
MSLLKTTNLSKVYRTDTVETTALNSVDIDIAQGEFAAIMGPSGCGKSTLLNIIGLLDSPSSGQYFVNGEDVSGYNERKRAEVRKSTIGFVFQSFNLIDELTVAENIELPLIYTNMGKTQRKQRVQEAMDRMNIGHRAKHFPQQLSGGQQQRVAIARAVVNTPKLILADEPTGNLDSAMGEEVMNLLTELNKAGTTIIIVTHSLRDAGFAKRTIKLLDGKVVEASIPASTLL